MLKIIFLALAATAIGAAGASAHVTLEGREAPIGASFKAVLRVPHGCEGKPTNTLRIQIPEGFFGVKPQPKSGWKLEKIIGKYEKAYNNHGAPMVEGVKEVIWSGGSLGDDEYDEFILRGTIADSLQPGDSLFFPVVQECPEGLNERWIEIPAGGQKASDLEMPAPAIKLIEKMAH